MANITGGTVPGGQLQLTDVDTDSPATGTLDTLLEKAKEEQAPALPLQVVWCPPPPCRMPESVRLALKRCDGERPHGVVHRRCHVESDRLTAVAERTLPAQEGAQRMMSQPERHSFAAAAQLQPQPQHAVAPLPRHPVAPLLVSPLAPITITEHQRHTDEPRRDNLQGVPPVKPGSEAPVKAYEPPSAPRHVKQEFTPPLSGALPTAKAEGDGQSRISYAFRSWGSEHRVELTSLRRDHQPLTVLLTPSDNLVNRRLQEAVAGQPLDVNLVLHDEGGGDQQQRQRDDNTPEVEDEA